MLNAATTATSDSLAQLKSLGGNPVKDYNQSPEEKED
jgi:hypothetical protein